MSLIKSLFGAVSGVVLVGLLTGCSSMMCGPRQSVSIKSRPAGAEVLIYDSDCKVVAKKTTPCVASLRRATADGEPESYVVLLRKKGFAPVQVALTGKVNDAYYLNIATAGLGMIVDSASGAKYTLTPGSVDSGSAKLKEEMFKHDDVAVSLKPRETTTAERLAEYKPKTVQE